MAFAATVFPGFKEWVGLARELTAGTVVAPVATIPVEKAEPDEKPLFLKDKSLRGSMGTTYAVIESTQQSEFDLSGPVYIDTIGYPLHNVLGDYTATGSTPANSTTLTAPLAVGATTATVASIAGYANGQAVQIGITGDGNPEVVTLSTTPGGSTLTFANTPARFAHASGKAVSTVVAPFSHIFTLLNSGNGQPVTHSVTHFQGISGSFGARQYAYWCASEVGFTMNAEQLFSHDTKGMALLGQAATGAVTNTISNAQAQPAWLYKVGIAGPASGGTQINDVIDLGITFTRNLKAYWGLQNSQAPYVIARAGLDCTGKFSELAQNENPMLNMINNTQPQLQFVITNGLSGANLLSCQFDVQVGAYETSKMNSGDEIQYDVTFCGVDNTTNVGASGGYSPCKVTLQNAVPTY